MTDDNGGYLLPAKIAKKIIKASRKKKIIKGDWAKFTIEIPADTIVFFNGVQISPEKESGND
jgi:GR25 family glycosyltransferase involved in LPS biosynthesis